MTYTFLISLLIFSIAPNAQNNQIAIDIDPNSIPTRVLRPICLGSEDGLRELFKDKYSINATNEDGYSPLMLALGWKADAQTIQILLDLGADVKQRTLLKTVDEGTTPLMIAAAIHPNPDILYLLTNAGADINSQNNFRQSTPLMEAALHNTNPEVLQTLFDLGSDPNLLNFADKSALALAVEQNTNPEIAKFLLNPILQINRTPGIDTHRSTTLLMHAVARNNVPVVKMLLSQGENPNVIADAGAYEHMTALMIACKESESLEISRLLINAGAEINLITEYELAPLSLAASFNKNEKIVELLLSHGANPNRQNNNGLTQFSIASRYTQYPERLVLLHDAGANLSTKDHKGWSAMHHAANKNNRAGIIRKLVELGFDIDSRTDSGSQTSLMIAVRYGMNIKKIETLIELGADVNAQDDNGVTPITLSPFQLPRCALMLIQSGANIDHQTKRGMTSLMVAVNYPMFGIADILLDAGADTNLKSSKGLRAIDIARKNKSRISPDLLKRLEEMTTEP